MATDKRDLIQKTLEVWQPLADKTLTEEDAREITRNVTDLFNFLLEADAELRKADKPPH